MRYLAVILSVLFCVACSEPSRQMRISELTLSEGPPSARMRAGYFEVTNPGVDARRVVSVQSNGFRMAEIHRTETVDGVSRMRAIPELIIKPGETVRFEPFGRHVMLMGANTPAVADADMTVTLCFDDQQCVTASAPTAP